MLRKLSLENFRKAAWRALLIGCLLAALLPSPVGLASPASAEETPEPVTQQEAPTTGANLYLPFFTRRGEAPRINAPHFDNDVIFGQTAIFWLGKVNQSENYTDVRVGYNDQELLIYTATFDKRLWFDSNPSVDDLTNWDALTLYLNTAGNLGGLPGQSSYRFIVQLSARIDDSAYKYSARGDGSGWTAQPVAFTTERQWRGDAMNTDIDDRGWGMFVHIPFSSLGLSGPPEDGSQWGLAVRMHDRDGANDPPGATKYWPTGMNGDVPSTWGQLRFGLPAHTPTGAPISGSTTIRHKLNGAVVKDAGVGGYALCGSGTNFWTQWGDTTETFYNPEHTDFNVQNQGDVADWPCYSKYYVTFPLDAIPRNKIIQNATLTLHLFGNAGAPGEAERSLVQVFTINQDWSDTNLTWNNAPLAWENVSRAWVDPVDNFPGWPGVAWTWDVGYALAGAYARGNVLRLVIYSADAPRHSGKYFVSSDAGDWNAVGRPTLDVTWSGP